MSVFYSRRYGAWPLIIAIVIVSIGVFQILRVNRQRPERPSADIIQYTSGTILNGPVTVAPNAHLAYRMDFNRRISLTGRFRTASRRERIACLVMSADNYELWKNGKVYKRLSETGDIPGGKINLAIEPGTYYLVLDNRRSSETRTVEAFFEAD